MTRFFSVKVASYVSRIRNCAAEDSSRARVLPFPSIVIVVVTTGSADSMRDGSGATNVNVLPSRMIVSSSALALAAVIAARRSPTLPADTLNVAARAVPIEKTIAATRAKKPKAIPKSGGNSIAGLV